METSVLVVDVLKALPALAWPVVALIFGPKLFALVKDLRVSKVKAGGVELELMREQIAAEARRDLQQLALAPSPPVSMGGPLPAIPVPGAFFQAQPSKAEVPAESTKSAMIQIMASWDKLEGALEDVARISGVAPNATPRGMQNLPELIKQGVVSPATARSLNGIQLLRALAATGNDGIDATTAADFTLMVQGALYSLEVDYQRWLKASDRSVAVG